MESPIRPEASAEATARDEIARALGAQALPRFTVRAVADEENDDALQLSLCYEEEKQDGQTLLLTDAVDAATWERVVRQAVRDVLGRMGLA